jgi:hypothetical protein
MGYYTLHIIRIINKYNNYRNLEKLKEVIEEVTDYGFRIDYDLQYIIDDNYNCGYGSKWYSFDDDIYEISKRLPKFKILVEAEEENGNTWERTVKGGYGSSRDFSDEDSSDNEEENENEENDDIEENEEEIRVIIMILELKRNFKILKLTIIKFFKDNFLVKIKLN